jgi:hypothetical protein
MTATTITPRPDGDRAGSRMLAAHAGAVGPARRWELGRVFVVRHAGMPFDWLEGLAAPADLLDAAAAVLDAEEALPATTGPDRADVRALRVHAVTARGPASGQQARQRWAEAVEAFSEAFARADEAACEALRAVLREPSVREAVFLSNPQVYRNMLVPYLEASTPLNARWRRVRRQLYTYVQRFCAKNETVSFFGPMAYARTVSDQLMPDGVARLRTDLPRRRRVFVAHWAAREVAAAVARDRRLRAVLPFRRTGLPVRPGVDPWLDDDGWDALLGPDGASLTALAGLRGVPVRDVAVRVQPLVACGYLEFGLAPAPYELAPLDVLAAALRGLPGEAAADWARRVAAFAALVQAVERAPFPERVDAVDALEAEFGTLTGQSARRGQGAVYADRAVFYEECSSAFALEIGAGLAARWAERVTAALELSVAHGAVTQQRAVERVTALLGPHARLALPEYGERLREAFDPGTSRFGTGHAPSHPAPAWRDVVAGMLAEAERLPGDRYALVDLCPATGDVSRFDTCDLVLSRCHHHLLTEGWLGTMFTADGEDGVDGAGSFGGDAARWVAGRQGLVGLDVGRRNKGYYRFPGRRLALRAPSSSDLGDPGLARPEQLTVESGPAGSAALRCTDADGRPVQLYLPLSDYVKYPPYAALSHPQVVHATFVGASAAPEVTVGGVVYQRPRWSLDPCGLTERSPAARFLALRRVARSLPPGSDRFVFCRTETERKPYLVDLSSVLAADLVAHLAAGDGPVLAEQMRPGPDELWLRDEQDRRYTSELRVQVIGRDEHDPVGVDGAGRADGGVAGRPVGVDDGRTGDG